MHLQPGGHVSICAATCQNNTAQMGPIILKNKIKVNIEITTLFNQIIKSKKNQGQFRWLSIKVAIKIGIG